MLLAIDTAAGTSVAVVERDRVLSVHSVEDTRRHAEVIGDLIQRSLADAGAAVSNLTGVAVGMGPGPFTGLRVGIAAAEAFANGAGLPLLRVASHDAVAFERFEQFENSERFQQSDATAEALLITTDARRQERYWSAYQGVGSRGIPHRVAGPEIGARDLDRAGFLRVDTDWISAASVGRLAERILASGAEFAAPTPLYLRSPDVTVAAARKRVSG